MKDLLCDQFQEAVNDCLIRHRSVLDILSKLQAANARISRSLFKSVTTCGCIEIAADKPEVPEDATYEDLRSILGTHVEGELCESCHETLEADVGNLLFWTAALGNVFDLNMYDSILKEHKKLSTLGFFHLT
jgi:hypothetical protein